MQATATAQAPGMGSRVRHLAAGVAADGRPHTCQTIQPDPRDPALTAAELAAAARARYESATTASPAGPANQQGKVMGTPSHARSGTEHADARTATGAADPRTLLGGLMARTRWDGPAMR